MRKADVIIPTFKPGDKLEKLLRRLLEQSVPVGRVIIMNTEEKYWDAERFESLFEGEDTKLTVCHIRQSEFDHGRTRHEGILKSDADVCICMTHDCVPYDRNLVKELLEALEEDEQKEFLEEVSREPVLLLLESDGAKHFPVKAPAEHEPVICEKTGIVLNVYGMRAIGKKIKDVCFRIGEVEKILGKTGEDILRPEDIMTLAVSRSAGRKCVTDEMEYQVILNQADTEEEKQTAMQLAEDIGKKLSEKYISEKNTKDTEFSGQISKVHVTSDLIPLEERW